MMFRPQGGLDVFASFLTLTRQAMTLRPQGASENTSE